MWICTCLLRLKSISVVDWADDSPNPECESGELGACTGSRLQCWSAARELGPYNYSSQLQSGLRCTMAMAAPPTLNSMPIHRQDPQ